MTMTENPSAGNEAEIVWMVKMVKIPNALSRAGRFLSTAQYALDDARRRFPDAPFEEEQACLDVLLPTLNDFFEKIEPG